jgi:type IV secretory pathway VirB10-like protein
MRQTKYFFVLALALIVTCRSAISDQVRYMDSSGNIHFVESLSRVPSQYRQQVIPPTPIPKYDKKQLAEIKRQQRALEVKKLREEKAKQREELKKKRQKEAELRKQEKENKKKQKTARFESLAR